MPLDDQQVGLGHLLIGFTSAMTGVAAVGVTLDWLRILEYPEMVP